MAEVKASTLSLNVDGRIVDIKTPEKKNFELNAALQNPSDFREFAKDPAGFAKKFGLVIDKDISQQLSKKIASFDSLGNFQQFLKAGGGESEATLWAVAEGSFSVSSSKIAVAF
jgi:hypothetical protein